MSQIPELLGVVILYMFGPFYRVRRYYRGVWPKLGIIVRGLSGWETMAEVDVFNPQHTFFVLES
jgi:hypothetical protein